MFFWSIVLVMKNIYLIILFFFGCYAIFAQEKNIEGQILINKKPAENVHVSNLTKNLSTISNIDGKFFIQAEIGDLIIFSAVHLDFWRQTIKKQDYEQGSMVVYMTQKTTELDEIEIVRYPNINAKDLGIINYEPKRYTQAQRRLYTANSGILDFLLNWFSGRTRMLKKGIEIEKKQFLLVDLEYNADDDYLIETIKIPKEYAQGFRFYAVEFPEIVTALKTKNKEQIRFRLAELAQSFLDYLKENETIIDK